MINLDDLDAVQKLDTSKMVDLLMDFPQQYQRAFDLSKDYISKQDKLAPEVFGKAKNIVISGMGGSAIGGDLLRALFADKCSIPIVINRNYNIPKFVNEDTLFIAASYSGNTEETLSALEEATEKNAKIFTISSGGELEKVSKNKGFPHFSVTHKGIQPRCAFGYLFMPMATLICKLGLITDIASDIKEAINLLSEAASEFSPQTPTINNQAKLIASELYDKLPVIYASQNYYDVVAMRWKGQFNENSKMMAFHNVIPEMNHNEIVGWGVPKDINQRCVVIMLSDEKDNPKIQKRIMITSDLISQEGAKIITVHSKGKSHLAKALYFIYLGDFASYYMASLNSVDPTPIERINVFKARLAN